MNKLDSRPGMNKGRQCDTSDPTVEARYRLNDIYCSTWLSLTITALVRKQVFDVMNDEGSSAAEIARKANLHEPSLFRALRALAANGIVSESAPSVFALNSVSRLLRLDHPRSWSGMARMWGHPTCLRSWEHFSEAIADGTSAVTHAFGKPLYEHLNSDPDALQSFSDAMISNSAHPAQALARAIDVHEISSVADLGGGVGTLLAAILEEHTHLRGILLELPELISAAEQCLARFKHRCDLLPGNFMESVPGGIDLYLIKNSMWNWNDSDALKIAASVRRAIGTEVHKRFLIIEYVIDDANAEWTTLYDMQMLNLPGGRARTIAEYEGLLARARFKLDRTQIVHDQTLLTFVPVV